MNGSMVKKHTSFENGFRIQCNRVLRSFRGTWLVNEFFIQFSSFNLTDTFKTGDWSSYIFINFIYLTNFDCVGVTVRIEQRRHLWNRFRSSICVKSTCWTERTGRPVDQANPKSKTKWKRKPRETTGAPFVFRYTGMAARIPEEISGMIEFVNAVTHTPVLLMNHL